MQKAKPNQTLIYAFVFAVIGIGALVAFSLTSGSGMEAHGQPIAYHHHAMLEYYLDMEKQPVPANIGIGIAGALGPEGMFPVHTHDASGMIHIESKQANLRLTFNDLLNVWGLDLSDKRASLFVNGNLVNYQDYAFVDGDRLRLEVVS